MPRNLARLMVILALLVLPVRAQEADDLPYRTEIVPSGDAALDAALNGASTLLRLQESAPTTGFGILSRAEGDRGRLAQALQSEGYWDAKLTIAVAGLPLGDPGLAERLETTRERPIPVRIAVDRGEQFRIGRLRFAATTPDGAAAVAAAAADPPGLAPGDPARAGPVLSAERIVMDRLLAAGHPLATIGSREATVDFTNRTVDVAWQVAPGPLARFAPPVIAGAERVSTPFLERYASRLGGETFSPARLEQTRKDLSGLGAFASVRAEPGAALDAEGRLPVTFVVTERPRHAVGISAAYETNYGPSVRVYWEHRNLFGQSERLRLEAEISRIGHTSSGSDSSGGAIASASYRIGGTLRMPGLWGEDITYIGSLFGVRERLEAFDRDAVLLSAIFEKRQTLRLTLRAGPVGEAGKIGPSGGPLGAYQTVGVLFGATWDGTDSLLDPARGFRVTGSVTPSYSINTSAPYAPARVTATTYWDVLGDRRSILALRGTLGSLLGANLPDVPQSQRFYAGGGGSVRGYDYQSIGPRGANGKPSGGSSLVEASLELRQRIWGDFGGVAFVDAGSVGSNTSPDFSNLRVGVGLGIRYYTPIGPIRADVALPLIKQQGSSGYGIYVGIGQAF